MGWYGDRKAMQGFEQKFGVKRGEEDAPSPAQHSAPAGCGP